jgi:hypothetical protein
VRHVLTGLLSLLVSACVPAITVPIPKAPPQTASDVDPAAATPRDGAGAIFVVRTKVLHDMGCIYDVLIDGQNVAALRRGEQVTLYADPGQRIVGVSIRSAKGCEPADAYVPVQVVAHSTTEIRVSATVAYDLKIEATTR